MPGTTIEWYELNQLTIPAYQQVCRNLEAMNLRKVWVSTPIERIREKMLYLRATEFSGRKADAMYY